MLEELEIHDLGPIHQALLTPAPGMTAITGETGAGKSMLLSAIRLISGGTADSGRVHTGAREAWAQGVFAVGAVSPVLQAAREAGVEPDDGELFLSRTVPVSGRSRAVLSGRSVPRAVLGNIASQLVTIHGQTDQLRIASAAKQREFLDAVSGDDTELIAYREAWNALHDMDVRLERMRTQESSARQQADYLRESIERINRVNPQPGEDEELKTRRSRIENAADIAQGVSGALAALDASQVSVDSDEMSASDLLNRAVDALRGIHADGDFNELADRLESLNADLSDIVFSLTQELDDEESVEDLDTINSRIHELGELTRRWGPTLADVIAWRDKAVFDVEDLDASPEKIAELEAERERLRKTAVAAAGKLSQARTAAAERLSTRVTDELASLAMAGSALDIRVTPRTGDTALDANGGDDIAFLFTPYEGSPQLPMGKSASGGELSRLMLALELSAADMRAGNKADSQRDNHDRTETVRSDMTFIFDEVDAGVGGKAAVELGRRLARLARSAQVIVVTHLAQVASWADGQFVVTKIPPDADDDDLGVITTVAEVRDDARVHEIARMLSGSESEASLDHARELLADSRLKG
ncbi:DNA repair protein RecN [Bifidobacterium goeldii]|uniref:DNA repair protein RecN n=1 Tax=Bifidobacterium goeldii TaxID=2306975 RepID=A0A430FKG1_9BIFI|nr:DNA repair protein RecN [Bifidobacterium goeldii]RSX53231.1 DNA repair protein RecN [Bifidobacterium goeldii]